MKHYMLIINGKLNNLNDYITACRTNPYKGAKGKAHNEKYCESVYFMNSSADSGFKALCI